jgi:hypothetical protein
LPPRAVKVNAWEERWKAFAALTVGSRAVGKRKSVS